MLEVAERGGALTVDPRKPSELAAAMKLLLTDDGELERLEREARSRTWPTWDAYAADLWDHLVPGS